MKSVRIWSYSIRMWENADQNNSEYGHFSRSVSYEYDGCTIGLEKLKQNEFIASWKGPYLEITYEKHRQNYFD